MKTKNEVLELVRQKIRLKHFACSTEQSYCGWVARYYDFTLKLPRDLAPEAKAEKFLSDLAQRLNVAAKTQNQALAAILFLYEHVLGKPLGKIDALRAKQPKPQRQAPSREQVRAFRAAVKDTPNTPARLLVDLLYGCGLRVSEPLDLRVKDILWGENQLSIRDAKGGKDRRVPIPEMLKAALKIQVQRAQQVWEWDRRNAPAVGVPLPNALAKKYPSAQTAWQWFYVFPAAGHCPHPRTGETVRYHLLPDALQRAVRQAATLVGLDGLITPHVLRHGYATHLLGAGVDIRTVGELMGHSSIETTAGYVHPQVNRAPNPLDLLAA
jgi:integron integrase